MPRTHDIEALEGSFAQGTTPMQARIIERKKFVLHSENRKGQPFGSDDFTLPFFYFFGGNSDNLAQEQPSGYRVLPANFDRFLVFWMRVFTRLQD